MNKIEKLQAAIGVFLGNRNHQPQIGFDHFAFGARGFTLATLDGLDHFAEFGNRQTDIINDKLDFVAQFSNFISTIGQQLFPSLVVIAGAGPIFTNLAAVPCVNHLNAGHAIISGKAHQAAFNLGNMPVQGKDLLA